MDDREFSQASDDCLARVAKWLESLDADEVDYSTADGSVTLEFADGTKFILSRQSATRQMWLAAGARAYHYDYDLSHGEWIDDKEHRDLYSQLSELVSEHVGHQVDFDA